MSVEQGKEKIYAEFATETEPSTSSKILQQLNPANHSILENVLSGLVLLMFVIVIVLAATHGGAGQNSDMPSECSGVTCLERSAYSVSLRNATISACDDFFKFACDNYKNLNILNPAIQQKTILSELERENVDKIETLMMSPVRRDEPNSFERKYKTFFSKCNDDFTTERLRGLPLAMLLTSDFYVFNESNLQSFDLNLNLQKTYGALAAPAFFEFHITPNYLDNDKMVVSIDMGGLGMSAGLYLGSTHQAQIEGYKTFIRIVATQLASDIGTPQDGLPQRIQDFVDDVVIVETWLANISRTADRPDLAPLDPANLLTLNQLDQMFAPIKFSSFFAVTLNQKVNANTKVAVQVPDYLAKVSDFINNLPLLYPADSNRKLSNYLMWRILQQYVGDLSSAYVHAQREFRASLSWGPFVYESRFDYCFRRVQTYMEKAVSAVFIRSNNMGNAKADVDAIFKSVRQHLVEAVDRVDWFGDEERRVAKLKLTAIVDKIAFYRDHVIDSYLDEFYERLQVSEGDSLVDVTIGWSNWRRNQQADSLTAAVDRNSWDGSTYDVNLHLNNQKVELTIPAGILFWPVYAQTDQKFVSYSTIGVMIAAELVKAIDSSGQYYGADGGASPWWTGTTLLNFISAANCSLNRFGGLRAGPYVSDSGSQLYVEMSELMSRNSRNIISTIDGLRIARAAYLESDTASSERPLPLSGLNQMQQFFVSWAQTKCYSRSGQYSFVRAAELKILPEEILVNGAVSLMPEFAAAFNCPANSPMVYNGCRPLFYNN